MCARPEENGLLLSSRPRVRFQLNSAVAEKGRAFVDEMGSITAAAACGFCALTRGKQNGRSPGDVDVMRLLTGS